MHEYSKQIGFGITTRRIHHTIAAMKCIIVNEKPQFEKAQPFAKPFEADEIRQFKYTSQFTQIPKHYVSNMHVGLLLKYTAIMIQTVKMASSDSSLPPIFRSWFMNFHNEKIVRWSNQKRQYIWFA